jgi:cytochrome c biogenesis protein CcdA
MGISLIFMVMGILILTGAYNTGELFKNNEFVRYLFGGILVIYGIFRAYNVYLKMKHGNKKLHYYDADEDQ